MALKDILSNAKYADDMVLNLPDGSTVQVGEIRALPVAERQALTRQIEERQSTLGQAELAFATKFQEAIQAGWMTADGKVVGPKVVPSQQQPTPQPTAAELRQAAQSEYGLSADDPLLGPVVKEMRAQLAQRDKEMADLRAEMAKIPGQFDSLKSTLTDSLGRVTGVVNTSVGRYLNDQYQSQFTTATKDLPKGVTVDYEAAYKYASEKGLKDKDGFLQIDQAVDRLTWDQRKKVEREDWEKQERTKLTKEIEEKQRMASLTPPQARNPLTTPTKDGDFTPFKERVDAKGNKTHVSKSLEEVLSEAAQDDEILKSAFGAASGMLQ
jgi:hypothetical protein